MSTITSALLKLSATSPSSANNLAGENGGGAENFAQLSRTQFTNIRSVRYK